MTLNKKALNNIKKEIQTDPEGRGYAGKTPDEIAKLLSQTIEVKTDILYEEPIKPKPGDKVGERVEVFPPRIGELLGGIEGAPNVLSSDDIEEALK